MKTKHILTSSLLGLFMAALPAIGSETNMKIEEYRFHLAREWPMHTGETIVFYWTPRGGTRVSINSRTIGRIAYPEVIKQIIVSQNRTVMALLVDRERKTFGFDFARLVTIQRHTDELWKMTDALVKSSANDRFSAQWVAELGAVGDEGKYLLLKMCHQSARTAPYSVDYRWETWDLSATKMIKEGLTMPLD